MSDALEAMKEAMRAMDYGAYGSARDLLDAAIKAAEAQPSPEPVALPITYAEMAKRSKDHWDNARKKLEGSPESAREPQGDAEILQLPPLTDLMYHAVRGSEYHFTSGGAHTVAASLNDDCLDEIWDAINTALRVGGVRSLSPRPVAEMTDDEIADIGYQSGLGCLADWLDADRFNNVEACLLTFARALLREATVPEWRPIETAPHGGYIMGAWLDGKWHCRQMFLEYDDWTCVISDRIYSPTHWTPLPADPKEGA